MLGPGIFLVSLTLCTTFTIFYIIKTKHQETMAKVEHGILEGDTGRKNKVVLNLGIFLCFVGLGFAIAYLIATFTMVPEHAAYPSTLLVSGGLGLIVSHFIDNSQVGK